MGGWGHLALARCLSRKARIVVRSVQRMVAVLIMIASLLATSPVGIRASSPPLLQPPASLFMFSPAVVGTPYAIYGPPTSGGGRVGTDNILTTHWWAVLPPGMQKPSMAIYTVDTMKSAPLAVARSKKLVVLASHGCVGNGSGCSTQGSATEHLLGHPGGGWLYGGCGAGECAYGAGASYRNVLVTVEVDCVLPAGPRCAGWTGRLVNLLVSRLNTYATGRRGH